jgi:hypothetical protein
LTEILNPDSHQAEQASFLLLLPGHQISRTEHFPSHVPQAEKKMWSRDDMDRRQQSGGQAFNVKLQS